MSPVTEPSPGGTAAGGPARRSFTIALAGSPNAGKTTLFNALTGTRQQVGNYPGVTVERKTGVFEHGGVTFHVVDLPGVYSLTACSADECVARDFILRDRPDLILDVADASNLERNLYLTVQFMELGVPIVLALNMSDVAEARGCAVNSEELGRLFNIATVRTVASKGKGVRELKDLLLREARAPRTPATVRFGREIEAELDRLEPLCGDLPARPPQTPARWFALKLLEGDEELTRRLPAGAETGAGLRAEVEAARERITRHFADAPGIVIAEQRYGFISGACQEAVRHTVETRHSRSDRIDEWVTGPVLGLPVFLLMMYAVFKATFTLAAPASEGLEALFEWAGRALVHAWPEGFSPALLSLLTEGVIAGVGGVVAFLPNVFLLFLAIAALEDSGYMARAAFIMDPWMHKIGLHGKSFIPMLLGFGCTVPALMATRILENRRDRLVTMMILPLFSCSARFPIYMMFIPALFPEAWRAPVLMLLYVGGVLVAVLLARLLRSTLFKGDPSFFVMELPPYRMPTLRGLLQHTWERGWHFLKKAGTVVLFISMVLWALSRYPPLPEDRAAGRTPNEVRREALEHSIAGRIGRGLEPVLRPLGFDWKASTAFVGALAAKEVFVAQLGIINALGDDPGSESNRASLAEALQRDYTRLQAFCIMLFCLLSMPCIMTVVTMRSESGAWRWALAQVAGLTLVAYLVTFAVYQTGLLVQRLWN